MDYFHEMIEKIRKRPGLFLGSCSITVLWMFLQGYSMALYDMKAEESLKKLQPLPFSLFNSFAANRCIKPGSQSGMGWHTIILNQCEGDEKKALDTFFELYDEFIALKIIRCYKTVFTENDLRSDDAAYESAKDKMEDETWPVYMLHPIEAYMIELSDQAGFVEVVCTESNSHLDMWMKPSKSFCEEEIKHYIRDSRELFWQEIEWNEALINDLVIW